VCSVSQSNPIVVLAGSWPGGRDSKLYRAASIARRFLSICFWECRMPLPFQLARECRNFFLYRIRAPLQSKLYRTGVRMGQSHQSCEGLECLICAETQARISDTQHLCTSRPYLTSLDWEIFLEGWQRGLAFRDRTRNGKSEFDTCLALPNSLYANPQPKSR
jgi:hypothetical protein